MVRVKICGITNVGDARLAVRFGADALGFNFVRSSRRLISRELARAIIASLPPFITPVGVFADEPVSSILDMCSFCGIHTVQLHGDEEQGDISQLSRLKCVKAIRIAEESDTRLLPRYTCDAYLLDAYVPGELGGTGETFNWEWAREANTHGPIILAGGLNPDNVEDAIRTARPYAVDVASGVESAPGRKDRSLLQAFIARAKGAES
jgi:phosphoribosylanthranilate isomerase